jgi:hypothetical protein
MPCRAANSSMVCTVTGEPFGEPDTLRLVMMTSMEFSGIGSGKRLLKPIPCATSDFVVAATWTPNNVTIEILWGEVSGLASTH